MSDSGPWDDLFLPYYRPMSGLDGEASNDLFDQSYMQASISAIQSPDPAMISLPSSTSTSQFESSQQSSGASMYYDAQDWSSLPPLPPSPLSNPPSPLSNIDHALRDSAALPSSAGTEPAFPSLWDSTLTTAIVTQAPPSLSCFGGSRYLLSPATSPSPEPYVTSPCSSAVASVDLDDRDQCLIRSPRSHLRTSPPWVRRGHGIFSQSAIFPNEVFSMILSELSPKDAYKCRLVCKTWYHEFWSRLVWNRWLHEVQIFLRSPTSWIFEKFSAATHSGQRFKVRTKELFVARTGVKFICRWHADPLPSESSELESLRLLLSGPVQVLAQFKGRRYWDFKLPLQLDREKMELIFDMRLLLHMLLSREEDEWPLASDIPKWVWEPPCYMHTNIGSFHSYA
ncbi:hypothetical protein CALCODRAFT_145865 [Calocera cornea HHB12733]|uniref:F-box domain-containing protein n=1 Tax=Calocera cornea HHB12733 TaxID=1353952 RepID=A0A165CRT4_9BASI|nr:hypothetical protein CALCODRAFT_145865 [Calocera cornea HHB12733]